RPQGAPDPHAADAGAVRGTCEVMGRVARLSPTVPYRPSHGAWVPACAGMTEWAVCVPTSVIPAPLARAARERDQAGTQVTGQAPRGWNRMGTEVCSCDVSDEKS